jgi:hypothetical protein
MFTKANAEAYFNGEKQESLLFMAIGVAAIVAALLLFFHFKHTWGKGAAWPLLLIGLMQLVVGYTVFARSDAQRKDIVYKMDMNPGALLSDEVPRMEKVMKNFVLYRYTEIGILLTGMVLFFLFKANPDKQFWLGIGAGLALQAALMLVADGFAERRGATYLDGIKTFLGVTQHKP